MKIAELFEAPSQSLQKVLRDFEDNVRDVRDGPQGAKSLGPKIRRAIDAAYKAGRKDALAEMGMEDN